MALLEEGVEVREEALPKLDHLAAYRLIRLAKGPWLLLLGTFYRMVAAERLKDTELREARQKLAIAVVEEAAYVHPGPRDPGEAHVLELGHAHPDVLPPRGVVPSPLQSVPLQPRVPRAGDDERPLVRPQL